METNATAPETTALTAPTPALPLAKAAGIPEPKSIPMRVSGPMPIHCPSGKLYILKKDWSIAIVSDPATVSVVDDPVSVMQNMRNQFSSVVNGTQVPVLEINTFSEPPPVIFPTRSYMDSGLSGFGGGFNTIFLSDEVKGTPPFDVPVTQSFYVFKDSTPSEVGRVRCSEVVDWADNPPTFLGA